MSALLYSFFIGHWALVLSFDYAVIERSRDSTTAQPLQELYGALGTCTEFRLRGNRAKSRFNYRVAEVWGIGY
ncbi:MAG: hypothetical protein V7K50_14280 [Nostoc sp.]|uniref:hypothetical protein n=1 Tax=Nostoc sp. TaxID=1180 RepID=UPI002FFA2F54